MEIIKEIKDETLYVRLTDRLDTYTSQDLSASLKEDITKAKEVIFDFSTLDYISSAGLRLLLTYKNTLGGKEKVKITNANAVIKNIFSITGFENLITVL